VTSPPEGTKVLIAPPAKPRLAGQVLERKAEDAQGPPGVATTSLPQLLTRGAATRRGQSAVPEARAARPPAVR
jgi:hypothetical protein